MMTDDQAWLPTGCLTCMDVLSMQAGSRMGWLGLIMKFRVKRVIKTGRLTKGY